MSVNVRDVSAAEFDAEVLARSAQVPVVVDFWAAWCGPCRVLGPILERAAAEANGEWELVKVDVDQNQQLAAEHGVQGIPTVVGFRDGRPVTRFTGALPAKAVQRWLRELVPSRHDILAGEAMAALEAGDVESAEAGFRDVLATEPSHLDAGQGLAGLLLDRGDAAEAQEILKMLPPTEAVQNLLARGRLLASDGNVPELEERLTRDPQDWDTHLELGRALAAAGSHAAALDHLQQVVESRADLGDEARVTMLDIFELLGDSPLVSEYRRRLANALF